MIAGLVPCFLWHWYCACYYAVSKHQKIANAAFDDLGKAEVAELGGARTVDQDLLLGRERHGCHHDIKP